MSSPTYPATGAPGDPGTGAPGSASAKSQPSPTSGQPNENRANFDQAIGNQRDDNQREGNQFGANRFDAASHDAAGAGHGEGDQGRDSGESLQLPPLIGQIAKAVAGSGALMLLMRAIRKPKLLGAAALVVAGILAVRQIGGTDSSDTSHS